MSERAPSDPSPDCPLCPRLASFRAENRRRYPDFFNATVPSFGPTDARLLIIGLAPGLRGANRTGRPFTGDFAGDLLYDTLVAFGFACGRYEARADDSLRLVDTRITNAVRCVPPENKPLGAEVASCSPFLAAVFREMPGLRAVLVLGRIAHDATLAALRLRRASFPFRHGTCHALPDGRSLYDSYHCSRYNTSTRVLTPEMFRAVVAAIRRELDGRADGMPGHVRQ